MSFSPRIDAIEQSVLSLNPNLLINGGMDFWQRNTSAAAVGTGEDYNSVDRWRVRGGGSGANAVSRSTDVPSGTGLVYSASNTFSGTNGLCLMAQPVEAHLTAPYVGRTLCFSAWVKPGANATDFQLIVHTTAIGVDQWTSNLGSSPGSIFHSETFTPTAGQWQRVYTTFVVPALGANGLAFRTTFSCTAAGTHLVAGAMVTEGVSPPTYFYRNTANKQAELAACQRYYQKLATTETYTWGFGHRQTATNYRITVPLSVPMRTNTPTFVESAASDFRMDTSADDTLTPTSMSLIELTDGRLAHLSVGHGATTGRNTILRTNGVASMTFDAEL